ncbi:hypothetical protein LOAG_17349 [Loa loa]|uniref:Uncharacterized protein n=1 Tax=Loa loa TaxID=7209 RepID=A0A1S0UIK5_LOALO|nr:hypothetical protein LOAG_17349 [Loa loa]EJD75520.1 hypothetical protein LOAG_17349 [Loa loa]
MSRCNEQWIVGTTQREFNSSDLLYLLTGLAFIIVPWNTLLCYISWQCMKITPSSFSLSLPRGTLSGIQKCPLVLFILKIILLACLLLSSWIPAVVTCTSRGLGRHIAELIFLPQIFHNTSPLSLFFIPFGFLPVMHIPAVAFCMIITVSEETYHVSAIKTIMIYCSTVFAILYYLSAYFMHKAINSFKESYNLECAVKTRHWMVAVIFAYLIGASCMITAVLLIIIRLTEASSKKKDDPLMNEDVVESPGEASNVSVSTAQSVPFHSNYGTIELSPQPFVVNSDSNGILNLRNAYSNQWVAIRILTNNDELNIHPTKFLLPPGRISAAEVTMANYDVVNEELPSRILIQWYTIGAYCPARNVDTLWTRPYYVPRDQWHYKIIRIYPGFI